MTNIWLVMWVWLSSGSWEPGIGGPYKSVEECRDAGAKAEAFERQTHNELKEGVSIYWACGEVVLEKPGPVA